MSLGYLGQVLQNLLGRTPGKGPIILRDYQHANKTFRTDGYAYAPKFKFLFHVYFDINPQAYGQSLNVGNNFGLAVKTVKLPSYNFQNETLNQYNRKRIIQSKIKYSPVSISFHDDNKNRITRLWNAYYTYYYGDGRNFNIFKGARGAVPNDYLATNGLNQPTEQNYNNRNIYDESISSNVDWGYLGDSPSLQKVPFFKNITIFGLNQHHFTAYTLINPVVNNFSHDTYSYSEGSGTMEMQMDLDYETVVYNEGAIDGQSPDNIVAGFGLQQNYDNTPSPYTKKANTGQVTGPSGYIPASGGFVKGLARGLFNNDHSQ